VEDLGDEVFKRFSGEYFGHFLVWNIDFGEYFTSRGVAQFEVEVDDIFTGVEEDFVEAFFECDFF